MWPDSSEDQDPLCADARDRRPGPQRDAVLPLLQRRLRWSSRFMIYFTMYGPTLLRKDVVTKIGPKGEPGPASALLRGTGHRPRRAACLVCQPSLEPERPEPGYLIGRSRDDRRRNLQTSSRSPPTP